MNRGRFRENCCLPNNPKWADVKMNANPKIFYYGLWLMFLIALLPFNIE